MDGRRAGRVLRAVRHQLGRRQKDVAESAGVSQSTVSRVELGRIDVVTPDALDRIARTLGVTLFLDARWNGGDLDRLIDREHAAIVERVTETLRGMGWEILVEYTFNHYGERGSVDVLAWHPTERALLIVEVKSRLTDLQATLSTYHRKVRLVPELVLNELGWDARTVGRLIVLPGTTANRSAVSRHAATFAAAFPDRMPMISRWLRRPVGPMSGLWFRTAGTEPSARRRRIRAGRH